VANYSFAVLTGGLTKRKGMIAPYQDEVNVFFENLLSFEKYCQQMKTEINSCLVHLFASDFPSVEKMSE
jgi:hypothetical protein